MRTNGVKIEGTGLQGYVVATRKELEKAFGKPTRFEGADKVTTQWAIEEGGIIATLYDYKEGRAPKANESYRWHIGGKSDWALKLVEKYLSKPTVSIR